MLAVCLVLLLGVLAGCGGGDGDETEITAGDFTGCWEAATADVWLCIYDDGTFEWYEGGSLGRSSTYEIYEDEICLDMGADMWLTLDDDGWLCHETEGLEMFPSQLPDYLR